MRGVYLVEFSVYDVSYSSERGGEVGVDVMGRTEEAVGRREGSEERSGEGVEKAIVTDGAGEEGRERGGRGGGGRGGGGGGGGGGRRRGRRKV